MAMSVVYTTVNGRILRENRGGVVHNFIPDPLGSVVMVRDTAGNTVYEAEYDPYGNVQSETGTNPSEFGYVGTLGYVKDSASSLYVRARYLLTNLGRWLTKDPLWPDESGYVYAEATPIGSVDPFGLQRVAPPIPVPMPGPIYGPPVRVRPPYRYGPPIRFGPPLPLPSYPPRIWPEPPDLGPNHYDFFPLPKPGDQPRFDPVICAPGSLIDHCAELERTKNRNCVGPGKQGTYRACNERPGQVTKAVCDRWKQDVSQWQRCCDAREDEITWRCLRPEVVFGHNIQLLGCKRGLNRCKDKYELFCRGKYPPNH